MTRFNDFLTEEDEKKKGEEIPRNEKGEPDHTGTGIKPEDGWKTPEQREQDQKNLEKTALETEKETEEAYRKETMDKLQKRWDKLHSKLGRLLATPEELEELDKEREEKEKKEKEKGDSVSDDLDEGNKYLFKNLKHAKDTIKDPRKIKLNTKVTVGSEKMTGAELRKKLGVKDKEEEKTTKGTATKGTATKGTATKGTATKGTATKGTATKGTATKGTATKGTATTVSPQQLTTAKKNEIEKQVKKEFEKQKQGVKNDDDVLTLAVKTVKTKIKTNNEILNVQKELYYQFGEELLATKGMTPEKRNSALVKLIDKYKLTIKDNGEIQMDAVFDVVKKGDGSNKAKKGMTSSNSRPIDAYFEENNISLPQKTQEKTPAQRISDAAKPDLGKDTIRSYKNDVQAQAIFAEGPLSGLRSEFKQVYGPVGENGTLMTNTKGEHSLEYLQHSITSNTALDRAIETSKQLSTQGLVDKRVVTEFEEHKKRLETLLKSKKIKVPSAEASKIVGNSYATLANNLHNVDSDVAESVMKQIGEMALYDTEIANGDECYLPAHGSFPSADKLKVETKKQGKKVVIEKVQGVSVKFGLAGGKWGFYGFPGETSKYQLYHPDERKRDMLSSKPGTNGYSLGIKDNYITDRHEFEKMMKDSKIGKAIKNPETFRTLCADYKKEIDNIVGEGGKPSGSNLKKLKKLEEIYAKKMSSHVDKDQLDKVLGADNANMAMKSGPGCLISMIGFSNILQTSNGLDMIEHNHQVYENGKYHSSTDDYTSGTIDIKNWKMGWRPYGERTQGVNASYNSNRSKMTNEKSKKKVTDSVTRYSLKDMLLENEFELEIFDDDYNEKESKLKSHFETYKLAEDD
jgi:hypothetical protein